MRLHSRWSLALAILLLPAFVLADTAPPSQTVAKMVGKKKVQEIQLAINKLRKRVQDGVHKDLLTPSQVQQFSAEVQSISDKRDGYLKLNGAPSLTRQQWEELADLCVKEAKKIHDAKHPGKTSRDGRP